MWHNDSRGVSRAVAILLITALVLVAIIAVPIINGISDRRMAAVDSQYVNTATKEARVLYLNNYKGFTAVFDTESKKFIDEKTAKKTVNPYGTSKEHQGKYLLITVNDKGDVSAEWITP